MNKELEISLQNWFKTTDFSNRNVWNRDSVAKIIKNNLQNQGHWRALPRGNPRKALRKMKYIKAVESGYQGEFEG